MTRKKTTNYKQMRENWKSGDTYVFTLGDVCKRKYTCSNTIYVIIGPSHDIGKYDVRAWDGPNPWDYVQTTVNGETLEKIDQQDPTTYNLNDRYPGPSNDMMSKLSRAFNKRRKMESSLTFEEKEKLMSYLDDELNKKRKIDDDFDSSEGDSEDDDDFVPDSEIGVDPVERKRIEILELD